MWDHQCQGNIINIRQFKLNSISTIAASKFCFYFKHWACLLKISQTASYFSFNNCQWASNPFPIIIFHWLYLQFITFLLHCLPSGGLFNPNIRRGVIPVRQISVGRICFKGSRFCNTVQLGQNAHCVNGDCLHRCVLVQLSICSKHNLSEGLHTVLTPGIWSCQKSTNDRLQVEYENANN